MITVYALATCMSSYTAEVPDNNRLGEAKVMVLLDKDSAIGIRANNERQTTTIHNGVRNNASYMGSGYNAMEVWKSPCTCMYNSNKAMEHTTPLNTYAYNVYTA